VKVRSQQTEEVLQESQDKPIVHQQTILKVMNGVADHQEAVQAASSTPTYSPKTTRKSSAPRFVSPLNGKIVDQGADVILDAVVDGECIRQLSQCVAGLIFVL
jgi:predicted kinase